MAAACLVVQYPPQQDIITITHFIVLMDLVHITFTLHLTTNPTIRPRLRLTTITTITLTTATP